MRKDNVMELSFSLLVLEIAFIVVGKAVHPGCECLVFSSTRGKEKGVFNSPDYPAPYLVDTDCLLYTFVAGPEEIVEITFEDFNVYKDKTDCLRGDYVKVFVHLEAAGINEYTPWESVYCGRMVDIPAVIYSSGPRLVFEFHSGRKATNATGFKGYFRFIDKRVFRTDGILLLNTMCDYEFLSTNQNPSHAKFYSPRYPSSYPKNVRCSYRFRARFKERIQVVFEEISLQKGDISCINRADLIRVYDGKSESDPTIRILCNEGNELEVLSTGSELFVEFVANSDSPGQGFKGRYQFQPLVESNNLTGHPKSFRLPYPTETEPSVSETRFSCDITISSDNSKNGTITSPSYPSPYPSKTACRYEFQGRGKERVQIKFHDFNLYDTQEASKECENQDSLNVFVHIDGRMEKIESFCGTTLPKPVMSNGPRLKLEFHSLYASRYSRGFNATYRFIENFGIETGVQMPSPPCAFEMSSNHSKSGYFHSPNFPGFYPRDTECYYYFYGNANERVHLHFNYFDVEGVSPCQAVSASDYVEFSNYMATDRKFHRYCGQLKDFDVESDRKFFRVTFKSNDRLDGTGFNATYQFLDVVEVYTPSVGTAVGVAATISGPTTLLFLPALLLPLLVNLVP